ncbi:hypothetical protein BaRGS_00018457 [Batillaria attramentaria]|uniref:Uncharacterized protein n=1 Tax=Batillaria attramentaria TaxID=370345 RepID=A0ABD0JWY3_9CAEN
MKKESMVKNLLRALLFVSGITLTTAKQCARFEFPTLDHEQLYAKDNSHVSVPFRLDTTSCSASGLFTISVTRDGNDVKFFDYCRLVHKDGVCGNSDSRCSCPDNQTLYHFNKIVDRNDSTTWNWGMHVQGELTGAAKIQFNIILGAPEFVGTPAQDEGESLKVGVRAHTRTIKACKMRRTHPHDAKSESPIDCAGYVIIPAVLRRSRRERQPEPVEEQEMVPPPIPPPRQDPEANRLAELARRSVYDDIFADLPQGYNRQNHPLPPCPDQPPPRPPRY